MLFNKSLKEWEDLKAIYTVKEIAQQPLTWKKTMNYIQKEENNIKAFLNKVGENAQVILTGAGTSEFVGNSLVSYLNKKLNYNVRSYATTDLVSEPSLYFSNKPTLLVSFARSGNSPESVKAVQLADEICENIYHLIIACNKDGELSKYGNNKEYCFVLNLPEETHDKSFVMTSSYTNMYLATVLVFNMNRIETFIKEVEVILHSSQYLLVQSYQYIEDIIHKYNFNRIVYLGNNGLKGVAQESALKICELTKGKVDTYFDSYLGFRHGPKSVINDTTLLVLYLSDDEYTRKYELDLLREISLERNSNKILVLSSYKDREAILLSDYFYSFENENKIESVLLGLQYILAAQLLALFKSIFYGFTPDNPCPSGEVNRVVRGVKLYPYESNKVLV